MKSEHSARDILDIFLNRPIQEPSSPHEVVTAIDRAPVSQETKDQLLWSYCEMEALNVRQQAEKAPNG